MTQASERMTEPLPFGGVDRVVHKYGWHMPDWSEFEIKLWVPGRPIVKKNNLTTYPHTKGIGPNKVYTKWQNAAVGHLRLLWHHVSEAPIPLGIPINLAVISYMPNKRGWPDLSGTYEGPQDVLEVCTGRCKPNCKKHSGVITNDSQVCGHAGSDRRISATNPRVELVLTRHRITR